MKYQFANNAVSKLQFDITATDTVVYIAGADAEEFPIPTRFECGYGFMVTLEDIRTGQLEICKCISRNGRRLTVSRGEEGTTAQAFQVGAAVSHRVTAGTLDYMVDTIEGFHDVWLGSFATHPVKNKNGCPLKAGQMYYNTNTKHIYIFDGADWVSDADNPFALDSKLYYIVSASDGGKTIFDGADLFGNIMSLSNFSKQPVTAHVNGVELIPDGGTTSGDYTVDYVNNEIVLSKGVPKGTTVSFSLFTDPDTMRPAGMVSWTVRAFNIDPATGQSDYFDDARVTFKIIDDDTGDALFPRSAREMLISMDGVMQQPGVDFLVSADEVTFSVAPKKTTRPWAFLYGAPSQGAGGTIDHTQLINRDVPNQHVISAVTGLQVELDGKSDINHNHDTDYSDINHNHDTDYSDINHNHDADYAPLAHTHVESDITDLDKYTVAEVDALIAAAGGLSISAENADFTVDEADGVSHWYVVGPGVTVTIPLGLTTAHQFVLECKASTVIGFAGTMKLPLDKVLSPYGDNAVIGFTVTSNDVVTAFGDLL